MNIHESAEDYLEAILRLSEDKGQVRSIDIVNELGYSKPSISIAMKKLRENGYIDVDDDGFITLNTSGLQIAKKVYGSHQILMNFLIQIGVSSKNAEADACKIEHILSEETYEKLKLFALSNERSKAIK